MSIILLAGFFISLFLVLQYFAFIRLPAEEKVLGQYNSINVNDSGLTGLPEYTLNKLSGGAAFGISAFPVQFNNGSKPGFYADI